MSNENFIHCDGLAEPNPGRATWAFCLIEGNETTHKQFGYLGDNCTNIQAEYTAVIKAAEYAQAKRLDGITIFTDLELVVKQVNGEWKCNQQKTREACQLVRSLIKSINATVAWVPGNDNIADRWTRVAYEQHVGRPAPVRRIKYRRSA